MCRYGPVVERKKDLLCACPAVGADVSGFSVSGVLFDCYSLCCRPLVPMYPVYKTTVFDFR